MASKNISVSKLHSGAEKAIKEAARGVMEDHKRTGRPVIIWRDGKVAKVPASQLLRKRS
jgi:hypothetical protein